MLRANKFENLVNSYNCVSTDVEMKSLGKEQAYSFRKERIIVSQTEDTAMQFQLPLVGGHSWNHVRTPQCCGEYGITKC